MATIQALVIDDDAVVRETLGAILQAMQAQAEFATNGIEGLAKAAQQVPDVILLDIMMPGMDGFEVCRQLRANPQLAEVPIIMISALDDRASRLKGLEAGADDFLSKPFDLMEVRIRLKNIAKVNRYRTLLHSKEQIERLNLQLLEAYDATIEGWSKALDLRDKETEGHSERVTLITLELAKAAGFTPQQLRDVRWGSLLHDVGKLGIPDAILLKPGPLTPEEWVIMKRHPQYAYEWLSPIAYLQRALEIPFSHHERWDGQGYPQGLSGTAIPLAARMFALADVWDALRSDRPYRKAWDEARVLQHLQEHSGTHFDPQLTELFLQSKPYLLVLPAAST